MNSAPTEAMGEIIAVDIPVLLTSVMIVAVECIGIVSWLKNFSKCPSTSEGCNICRKCRKRSKFAIIAFAVLIPCALFNTTLVHPMGTAIFDIIFLGLAVEQLGYKSVTDSIPKVIAGFFDKFTPQPPKNT